MKRYCLIPVLAFLTATLFSFPAFSKTVNKFEGKWSGYVSICHASSILILKINAQGKVVQDQRNGIANTPFTVDSYAYGHVSNTGILDVAIPPAPKTPPVVENGLVSLYNHGKSMHFEAMVPCGNYPVLDPNPPKVQVTTTLQKVNT